ncbi:hypothetical protein Hanom_Chr15g01406711 [Helianthus anomalus]
MAFNNYDFRRFSLYVFDTCNCCSHGGFRQQFTIRTNLRCLLYCVLIKNRSIEVKTFVIRSSTMAVDTINRSSKICNLISTILLLLLFVCSKAE